MAPTTCCHSCGSFNLIDDNGETACANCGTIVAEHRESNVPEFMENASGGHSLVGQIFNDSGTPQRRSSIMPSGHGRESREIVLEKGRRIIQHIISGLRITQNVISEASQRWYKLAVVAGFNKGRSTQILIASCVYVACRMNKPRPLPYMLIDFSEYLRINVFVLGHTFLELCKKLTIQLPLIDPSLFIPRFASQLNFAEKELEVCKSAIRIVARMKRDWILYGRRPAGVCGAGLMVASYLHDCKKTQRDIIKVVKISDRTLQKRLQEFEQVPSADLTPAEFEAIDFEHFEESDPPAYTRGRLAIEEKKNMQVPSLEQIETNITLTLGPNITKEELLKLSLIQRKRIEDQLQPHKVRKLVETSEVADEINSNGPLDDGNDYEDDEGDDVDEEEGEDEDGEEYDEEEEESENDENLSDLDDEEAKLYIYSEEEQKFKSLIWKQLHADYLKEQAEKEKQLADNPNSVRVRKPPKKREASSSDSALDVKSALERRISTKINYDALNGLLKEVNGLPLKLAQTNDAEEEEVEEEEEDGFDENTEYNHLKRLYARTDTEYDYD